jgi:SAM-dependent methyltransferase
MTLQVSVLGIDGSGKSSLVASLSAILAGELNVVAGSAGETFWVMGADEDHLAPKFHPYGFPLSARLAKRFKKLAKRFVNSRRIYPIFKLGQMLLQDAAARNLARRYGAEVMVSDGNVLLSAFGRAANYRRPASDGASSDAVPAPDVEDLAAVLAYLLEGKPLPVESLPKLPRLDMAMWIDRLCRWLGLGGVSMPDAVIFLDVSPRVAMERIAHRHAWVDRHENESDLAQARAMYLKTLEAYERFNPQALVCRIPVDKLSPGEVLEAALEALRPRIAAARVARGVSRLPLGTTATKLTGSSVWARVLNARYLFRYLLPKFFCGAWREPFFPFSKLGRVFLKEGYSAKVMQLIYDQHEKPCGPLDRIFLGYPLHRAVHDRLQILSRKIEAELERRLKSGGQVSIFTAPSGVAYDLFQPLEAIARRSPELLEKVELTAADLDPHGCLARTLTERAEKLGIQFRFLRGDLTNEEFRAQFTESAKFDVALFVGLSGWLPRSPTIRHLKWLRARLRDDGVLVSDCFTAASYALSGHIMGYKAAYYTPDNYRALLDYCGFDGLGAEVESGLNWINHVIVVRPRPVEAGKPTALVAGQAHQGR